MSEDTMTIEDSCILDNIVHKKHEDTNYIYVEKENRITKNKLTMYEFVRIMGEEQNN